ncbi:MAG: hypothetical protein QW087_07890 [Methanomassiliicoccales archaeon]
MGNSMLLEVLTDDKKDVITKDGKRIGTFVGATVDTETWKVVTLVVEVSKDVIEDLKIKKSVLKIPRVAIKTDSVGVVGDIVQLNIDFKTLPEYL